MLDIAYSEVACALLARGHAKAHIRRNLVRQGYIKGIISLPANLF
jgi:type I restriction enzyme M protein